MSNPHSYEFEIVENIINCTKSLLILWIQEKLKRHWIMQRHSRMKKLLIDNFGLRHILSRKPRLQKSINCMLFN